MQKWEYLRLTVSYRGEDQIYSATLNGRGIFSPDDKANSQDLQSHIEGLGDDGWELVTVFENHLFHEIYHFKRLVE